MIQTLHYHKGLGRVLQHTVKSQPKQIWADSYHSVKLTG